MDRRSKQIILVTWLLGIYFLAGTSAWAQKKKNSIDVAYGDEYYKNGDYFQAEKYYLTALQKQSNSSYISYRIAECNRLMFNYTKAEDFYAKTLNNTTGSSDYPLALYWYALMQKMNGKYEEANGSFEKFIASFQPKNKEEEDYLAQAKTEKEGCEFAILELKKPQRDYSFKPLPIPVNTKYSDYSPAVYHHDSSIVITSSRENTVGGNTYDATGESFSDNLRFHKGKDGKWVKSEAKDGFDEIVNTKYNDGAGVFTKEKRKFYYTQCDDDQGACAIYVTKFVSGKWSKPIKLNENINDPGGWNAQPSLSSKGDTMYFVSKRQGGLGQHDIWFSVLQHPAKGHKAIEENWGKATNMGPKVNTPFIEMAPSFYSEDKTLFFASTGYKGFGGLDIYMFKIDSSEAVSNLGLPFNSNKDDFYFVLGEKKGFLSSNRDGGVGHDDIYTFNIQSQNSLLTLVKADTLDTLANSVSVKGKILDEATMEGVPDLENMLADESGNVIKKSKTNKEGAFRYDNLDKTKNYKVLLEENKAKVTKKQNFIVADVKIEGSKAKPSKNLFENIYFDFDKAALRPEAIKVLDELVEYLKKYPHLQVELRANTDAFGTNKYNIDLSKKRGEVAMDYLVSKGVDRSAMVVDARGEGKPIATNENEIGRQLNRRVEFYILGDANFQASGMVYILQPKNTLFSIAKENGMTVEELKSFNGLEGEDIKAYTPLRIPRRGDAALVAPVTMSSLSNINSNSSYEGTFGQEAKRIVLSDDEEIYTVQPGNTMFSIAKQHDMTVTELQNLNNLKDVRVVVGQKLKVKKK